MNLLCVSRCQGLSLSISKNLNKKNLKRVKGRSLKNFPKLSFSIIVKKAVALTLFTKKNV